MRPSASSSNFSNACLQKSHTRDLIERVGTTWPDRIALEQGLHRLTELSWFLDENEFGNVSPRDGGPPPLPKAWRLGDRPNLKQMHDDACANRVTAEAVEVSCWPRSGRRRA